MSLANTQHQDMLQTVANAWDDLQQLLDSIPENVMDHPNRIGTWSGKEMIAHLAGWEEVGIDIVRQVNETGSYQPLGITRETVDAFNETLVAPYRDRSVAEVRHAFADIHASLVDLASRSQVDHSEIVFDVTRDHYAKHLSDLRQLLT